MKHTPGPWFNYTGYQDRFAIGAYRLGMLCISVADCKPREIITASGDHSILEEEALANAKLIAAAPDLLKVCEMAFAILKQLKEGFSEGGYILPYNGDKPIEALEQAIKKATV